MSTKIFIFFKNIFQSRVRSAHTDTINVEVLNEIFAKSSTNSGTTMSAATQQQRKRVETSENK